MAYFQGNNLGNALINAENIKTNRLNRAVNNQALRQDAQKFKQAQQLEGIKRLNMAAADIYQSGPQAIARHPQFRGQFQGTPDQIRERAKSIFQGTTRALQAYNASQHKAVSPTATIQDYDRYQQLLTEDPKKAAMFLNMKRAPYSWQNLGSEYAALPTGPGVGEMPEPVSRTIPPEQTPDAKAAVVTAQETAKQEVESSSPEAMAARKTRYQDNMAIIATIDSMLGKDEDGELILDYAYGRANVITPNILKPTNWVNAEAKRDQIVSALQLENVKKLKGTGPITENEQKTLRQAATILSNELIDVDLAKQEMERVRSMFEGWAADAKKGLSDQVLNWEDM